MLLLGFGYPLRESEQTTGTVFCFKGFEEVTVIKHHIVQSHSN